MKKKITIGSLLAIVVITAMALLIGFNTPVFYNTNYEIVDNVYYKGYIRIIDGHTIKYYENETDAEPMVYDCVISGDTLTFRYYTFKIQSKFKMVLTSNNNCVATPCRGGVITYILLLLLNIPATTALCIMFGMWITKKQKYAKEQINKVQILEDILVREKIINKDDLDKIYPKEKEEHIEHCSNCGYQLFDEDTQCPNCGENRRDKQ